MPSADGGKSGLGPWKGTYVGSMAMPGVAPVGLPAVGAGAIGVGAHAAARVSASAPLPTRRKSRLVCMISSGGQGHRNFLAVALQHWPQVAVGRDDVQGA